MTTLFLVLAAALQAPQAQYPVRWTRAVGPPSRQALQAKLRDPVKQPRSQRIYEHNKPHREIGTCAAYARAKKSGWEAADHLEVVKESLLENPCETLALVLTAKPSRVSYVKGFKLDEAALDQLPPSLSGAEDPDGAAEAERQGLSWKKFKPGLKIQRKYANGITVLEPELDDQGKPIAGESATVDLEVKAFGDFNGDGIEDVLLSWRDHDAEGRLGGQALVILTRVTEGGLLKASFADVKPEDIEKVVALANRAP